MFETDPVSRIKTASIILAPTSVVDKPRISPVVDPLPAFEELTAESVNIYDSLSVITSSIGRKMSSSSVDGAFGAEPNRPMTNSFSGSR